MKCSIQSSRPSLRGKRAKVCPASDSRKVEARADRAGSRSPTVWLGTARVSVKAGRLSMTSDSHPLSQAQPNHCPLHLCHLQAGKRGWSAAISFRASSRPSARRIRSVGAGPAGRTRDCTGDRCAGPPALWGCGVAGPRGARQPRGQGVRRGRTSRNKRPGQKRPPGLVGPQRGHASIEEHLRRCHRYLYRTSEHRRAPPTSSRAGPPDPPGPEASPTHLNVTRWGIEQGFSVD